MAKQKGLIAQGWQHPIAATIRTLLLDVEELLERYRDQLHEVRQLGDEPTELAILVAMRDTRKSIRNARKTLAAFEGWQITLEDLRT